MRKRWMCGLILLTTMSLLFCSCALNTVGSTTTTTTTNATTTTATKVDTMPAFAKGDATLKHAISKTECVGPFKGKNVTVNTPIFTGFPVESVWSYKDLFPCLDGLILFKVALEGGSQTIALDKTGARVENPQRSTTVSAYLPNPRKAETPLGERHLRGNGVFVEQTGEPGNYVQQLFNLKGEAISDFFDSIGYFYNGIALIEQDGKIGLLADTGEVLLEPCLPVDTVVYETDIKEKGFDFAYMTEDAFVLPVGGEFAIFTVTRE